MRRFRLLLALGSLVVVICSCGGGSSGGGSGPPPPAPDFAISVSPTSATVSPGGTLLAQVTVAAENAFNGSVSVSVIGLPTGVTVSPSATFTMHPGSQSITINVSSKVAQGNFTIGVQGASGSLQHSASIALMVQTQALASFSVYFPESNEVSFTQGGSGSIGVGLSVGSGNANYEVLFSVTGVPSGVQATFGTNPLVASQPPTSLVLSAGATTRVNYATITVTATRTADGMQETGQLTLNVTPPVGTLPAIRADFVRMDGTPAAAVYDSVHNVVYASNTQWNRVDVISPATHQIVNSIPAPGPTGMDMSLDGRHLIVTTNVQQIVSIDTTSLQVVQRTNVPIQPEGVSSIPDLIANTSNGTVLLGMTYNSLPPSYSLEQWNPATGSFTALTAPSIGSINQLVRTGDGVKALVVDYGSGVNLAVYDAPSNTFTATGQSTVGQVLGVAASPTAHQFAIAGTNGLAFVDSNLNLLATAPVGGGLTYSFNGTNLYVAVTFATSLNGPFYPVILTYNTSSYALTGVAPAEGGSVPFVADNAGLIYGAGDHGMVIDDSTNLQNVLSLPVGVCGVSQIASDDEAPLNSSLVTGLGQTSFDVLPDVWFGNARGTNIQFGAGGLVSVTAPASAVAGLVNVKVVQPDGWFCLVEQSFSYGPSILFLGGNASPEQGGASLALIGYGLIGNTGNPTVTIGGQTAKVTAAAKYVNFNYSTINLSYPFSDIDEVMVTIPPGSPGPADVTLTSSAGTTTLSKAFDYLPVSDYSSADTLTYVVYDPQRHWVYLSAGNHIDVFSADTNQFLTPIVPPSVSGMRQIKGLALTPDNSKLLAANFADISVAIIDPDNPSSSTAVQIPITSIKDSPGVADVVATSTGKVFVDGVSGTDSGCAFGQLWELDLTTLKSTLRSDIPALEVAGLELSRDAVGNQVLVAGVNCGTYIWSASSDSFIAGRLPFTYSSATSADGYLFASDYTRIDAQMIQHMQAQLPDFFTVLLTSIDTAGEKMNASGSLLYTPVPQGFGKVQSNGIEITDTNLGTGLGQIMLSEQISQVQNAMDFDEVGNRLFVITNKGVTVVQLSNPPVSIGYLNPATGSTSGGTTVTIRGSGFESGASVTFGGTAANTTFVDGSTLQVVTPAGPTGGTRVSVKNPDGTSYSLDAGFSYQ